MSISECSVCGSAATRATVELVEHSATIEDMLALFSEIRVDSDGLLLLDGGMCVMMSAAVSMVEGIEYEVAVLDKAQRGYLVVISRGTRQCGDLISVREVH